LQRDELEDGTEIVAEMQVAGRLHPGKDSFFESHRRSSISPGRPMPRAGRATQGAATVSAIRPRSGRAFAPPRGPPDLPNRPRSPGRRAEPTRTAWQSKRSLEPRRRPG